MGELTFLDEGVVGEGYLYGVEVLALDVLHKCHLHHLSVGGHTDVGRQFGEAGQLGGTETALTGNELVFAVGHAPDGDGSDDALFTDGLSQLFEGIVVELFSGLEGVGLDVVDGYHADSSGDIGCGAVDGFDIDVAQYGIQSTSGDKVFLICHWCV